MNNEVVKNFDVDSELNVGRRFELKGRIYKVCLESTLKINHQCDLCDAHRGKNNVCLSTPECRSYYRRDKKRIYYKDVSKDQNDV